MVRTIYLPLPVFKNTNNRPLLYFTEVIMFVVRKERDGEKLG